MRQMLNLADISASCKQYFKVNNDNLKRSSHLIINYDLFSLIHLRFLSSTTSRNTLIGMTGTIISRSSGLALQRVSIPVSVVSVTTASKRVTNVTPILNFLDNRFNVKKYIQIDKID